MSRYANETNINNESTVIDTAEQPLTLSQSAREVYTLALKAQAGADTDRDRYQTGWAVREALSELSASCGTDKRRYLAYRQGAEHTAEFADVDNY